MEVLDSTTATVDSDLEVLAFQLAAFTKYLDEVFLSY